MPVPNSWRHTLEVARWKCAHWVVAPSLETTPSYTHAHRDLANTSVHNVLACPQDSRLVSPSTRVSNRPIVLLNVRRNDVNPTAGGREHPLQNLMNGYFPLFSHQNFIYIVQVVWLRPRVPNILKKMRILLHDIDSGLIISVPLKINP